MKKLMFALTALVFLLASPEMNASSFSFSDKRKAALKNRMSLQPTPQPRQFAAKAPRRPRSNAFSFFVPKKKPDVPEKPTEWQRAQPRILNQSNQLSYHPDEHRE